MYNDQFPDPTDAEEERSTSYDDLCKMLDEAEAQYALEHALYDDIPF